MRTKTLLVTAALGAAGLMTASAQVYSVNAVGYVNITVPTGGGLALIANPLNGTNNQLNTIMPLSDDAIGTAVFLFDSASQNYSGSSFFGTGVGWLPDLAAPPGEGFFVQAVGSGPTLGITFVGEVPQGALVNTLPAAPLLGLKSSIVPQAGSLGDEVTPGTLNFPAETGDTVFKWDVATQNYVGSSYFGEGVGWLPDAVVGVAEGFFIQKTGTKTSWSRNFSVNP